MYILYNITKIIYNNSIDKTQITIIFNGVLKTHKIQSYYTTPYNTRTEKQLKKKNLIHTICTFRRWSG